MAKQNEIDYLKNIGELYIQEALDKPFSDSGSARYLMDAGNIFFILPNPPARILDLGVGSGWTSIFYALKGYSVIGQDIAPNMIELARLNKSRYKADSVDFIVQDFEDMHFSEEFDAAVFYDCLHHAEDERLALSQVYNALKPGGVCLTVEPGVGHSQFQVSKEAVEKWGVTEKDMPPEKIIQIGNEIGFRKFRIYKRIIEPDLIHTSETSMNSLVSLYKSCIRNWRAIKRKDSLRKSNLVVLEK